MQLRLWDFRIDKEMIISRLKGGLGNQLFQYAIGRQIAYKQDCELKLDLSYFTNQVDVTPREFKLGFFNIKAEIATPKDISKVLGSSLIRSLRRRCWKWEIDIFKWNQKDEKSFEFQPELLNHKGAVLLNGYWQNEAYFTAIRSVLLDEIALKPEHLSTSCLEQVKEISETESVAVHVRRGDYISNSESNKTFFVCTLDYYVSAISQIKKELKTPKFYVFSDEIDWCKENLDIELIGKDAQFVSGYQDYEDLWLMSKCKHQIIANSSFSWWAAWLNTNKDKKVIAPKNWFKNAELQNQQIVPADWLRL